jgi:hypothetical protein
VKFVGSDRAYEHLETYPGDDMDGNAWQFQIGTRPALVVGPSYEGGVGTSQQQIDWVIDVFERNPNLPGVLLIHDMIEHFQVYNSVVLQMPTVAPNLFLTAQGHIQQDIKFVQDIEGFQVMRTVSDWSHTDSPGGSYFAVLRFYLEPGQQDEVEAFTATRRSSTMSSQMRTRRLRDKFLLSPSHQRGVVAARGSGRRCPDATAAALRRGSGLGRARHVS